MFMAVWGWLLENLKAGQSILPQSLQALDTDIRALKDEETEVEGAIRQLQTRIDRPLSAADMVNDINNFDLPRDKLNYMAENSQLLSQLSQQEQNHD